MTHPHDFDRFVWNVFLTAAFACSAVHVTASNVPAAHEPGAILAEVDATQMARHLLMSKLTIPVEPGKQAFWFPKWIPGIHGPGEQIRNVAGLTVASPGGEPLAWSRDPNDLYRILVDVPDGVESVVFEITYIANQPTPLSTGVDSHGNADVLTVNFNTCLIYRDHAAAAVIPCALSVRLPEGWGFGTALRPREDSTAEDGWHHFHTESVETVIDSPLIAGRNYRKLEIETPDFPKTNMHFVSESPKALEFDDEQVERYKRLMAEAAALFGGAPFDEYDFLVVCSDRLPSLGLEHHASSLNGIPEEALVDDDKRKGWSADLLTHEFSHAWCGKYRRPAGMVRPAYHSTKQTELLWIYEGLTQYLGQILAARCGLVSFDEHLERTAGRIGYLSHREGRNWRSLADTAIANYTLRGSSQSWNNLRRGQDYYDEGALFWLEVDCRIRRESGGEKSLDDFCQRFFAAGPDDPKVKPYTLDEVIQLLNELVPNDWLGLVRRRVYRPLDDLQLEGLWLSGYEYTFTDQRPEFVKLREDDREIIMAEESLGLTVNKDHSVAAVVPGSPADAAGLAQAMELIGVNGRKFTADRFREAIRDSKENGEVELLLLEGDNYRSVVTKYSGGERYPALERLADRPDLMREICSPHAER